MTVRLYILLLIFVGFFLYLNALPNKFIGDDIDQIVRNSAVHSVSNIPNLFAGSTYSSGGGGERLIGLYYRPLMLSIYTIMYSLVGPDPLFYRLFQILLHISISILIFAFFQRFTKREIAFFAALIFLVHPINVETVVYIADMQDILFVLFGMIGMLLLRYQVYFKQKKLLYFGLVFVTTLAMFFSKESGILFLPILLIYLFLIEKKPWRTIIRHGVLFASNLGVYLFFRFVIAKMFLAQTSIAPITHAPLGQRLLHIPLIVFTYLKTIFFPVHLITSQFWFIERFNWLNLGFPLIVDLLFFGLLIYLGFKIRSRSYIFFFIWFVIGLGFHIQLYPLDMTVAERWMYFPLIGLVGMMAVVLSQLKLAKKWQKQLAITTILIIVGLLAMRTFTRNYDWKDTITLYTHDLEQQKGNFIIENALATEYISAGEYKKAKPYVVSSVKTYPFYANLNNLAIIQVQEKNIPGAKQSLLKAVNNSRNFMVYENLANFLLVYDKPEQAKVFAEHALKDFPENARLWIILAQAEYFLNNEEKALKVAEKAARLSSSKEVQDVYLRIKQGLPIIQVR